MLAGLGLVVLTLVAHAIVLATPGFFSHDEWQKFDHIRLHGFWDFARAYGTIRAGTEFGYPVRPIGFIEQGIAALWMQSAPLVAHLVGVVNHALVALIFVWVLRRAGIPGATAGIAGVLFVLSPLTAPATAWLAASFDQLYVLFLLLVAAAIVRLPDEGMSVLRAAWIAMATAAALLSKETAIIAPGLVLLLGYVAWSTRSDKFSWPPFGIAFVVVLLPVVTYLAFRASAIAASVGGQANPAYTPDLWNAPANILRFFAYPFRLKVVEMSANVFSSPWQPLAAVAVHLLLVGAVYRLFGRRLALAYVASYFLFLLPVLLLPTPGAHYLYAAALPMSLAMAATLQSLAAGAHRWTALLVIGGAIALYAHDLVIQRYFYDHGKCQARFLADADAWLAQARVTGPSSLFVIPEKGALSRVGIRAVAAREPYVANGRPLVVFASSDQPEPSPSDHSVTRVRMTAACTLLPQ